MLVKEPVYKWRYALTPRVSPVADIIVHHAAGNGSPEDIHAYHQKIGWNGIAYHYYIRKDGIIYRGRPENMVGGHTTNHNYNSIGVCFEGNFDTEMMSETQRCSGVKLLKELHSRYTTANIVPHREYQNTACPGKNFPFNTMVAAAMGSEECVTEPESRECSVSDWAKEALQWAHDNTIYVGTGTSENMQEPFSKERTLVLLYRLFEKLDKKEKEGV